MRRLAVLAVLPLLVVAGCGGDDDGASAAGFCDRARAFESEFAEIEAEFESDEMPTAASFEASADAISGFADDAPAEIKDDLEAMADAMGEIAGELEGFDLDESSEDLNEEQVETMMAIAERMGEIGEEVEDAGMRVEEYLEEECGISSDE